MGKKTGRKRAVLAAVLFLLAAAVFAGCGKQEEEGNRSGKGGEGEAGAYQIYYLDPSGLELRALEYRTETSQPDQLVGELAGQLLAAPADSDCQPALADKVQLLDIKKNDNILYLNFSKDYSAMEPVREVLCRAAFVKTLTQVEGVEFISVSCEGQPMLDSFGNPLGVLGKSDFVEGVTNINSYEKAELTLYFANGDGTALEAETREVVHSANTSLERLIVEQLIEGPMDDDKNAVLPKDTKVLNVSVAENICYVNFDSSFLSGTLKTSEKLPIYAIVNSLTELQNVNKVQITVDGSQDVMYRDLVSLSEPFERDEQYIEP